MKLRNFALFAIYVSAGLNAATLTSPQLAIYYSFDASTPPPTALFTEMQSELSRILAPAGLQVAWRASESPRNAAEDFPGIVLFRFHGTCFFDAAPREEQIPETAGLPLAQTQIMDGRVLPFGGVNCDEVRRFIAPSEKSPDLEQKDLSLGRALARVIAHEVYHVLTGSPNHASQGIGRSAHSRAELTEPTFGFAASEINWLRSWVAKQTQSVLDSQSKQTLTTTVLPSRPQSSEPESADSIGR